MSILENEAVSAETASFILFIYSVQSSCQLLLQLRFVLLLRQSFPGHCQHQLDAVFLIDSGGTGKPFINAETIAQMKDGVVIVNISRGSNVDEAALLAALNSGKVRAAGLDVWADEKNPNWELAAHPYVSCTPHIGASTTAAQ